VWACRKRKSRRVRWGSIDDVKSTRSACSTKQKSKRSETYEEQTRSSSSAQQPLEPSDSPAHLFVRITAQHILSSDKQLLRDEGHGEQESERPSEDGSEGEEEGSEVDPSSGAFSVRRSWLEVEGVGEEGGVHSGCRRKEG
jgi:hypothetical protein